MRTIPLFLYSEFRHKERQKDCRRIGFEACLRKGSSLSDGRLYEIWCWRTLPSAYTPVYFRPWRLRARLAFPTHQPHHIFGRKRLFSRKSVGKVGIFAYCGTPKTHRTTCGSHRRTRWERAFPVAVQGTGSGKADRHCCRERSFRKHSRIADTFLLRQSYLPNTYLRQPCGLLPQHFPLYRQLRACVPSALVGHFQLFPCHILHPQVHKIGEWSHI